MLTSEKAHPNLHREMVMHHMKNGLRKSLTEVVARTTNVQHNRVLRKGVYAISSLLGSSSSSEELFNGFKDEFTDFKKSIRKGKDIGLSW
jgi:hypothetical protein